MDAKPYTDHEIKVARDWILGHGVSERCVIPWEVAPRVVATVDALRAEVAALREESDRIKPERQALIYALYAIRRERDEARERVRGLEALLRERRRWAQDLIREWKRDSMALASRGEHGDDASADTLMQCAQALRRVLDKDDAALAPPEEPERCPLGSVVTVTGCHPQDGHGPSYIGLRGVVVGPVDPKVNARWVDFDGRGKVSVPLRYLVADEEPDCRGHDHSAAAPHDCPDPDACRAARNSQE